MTNSGEAGGVGDALARIAERSASLSQLDDTYLRLTTRSEEALRALGIGLRLVTVVERDQEGEEILLVFDKTSTGWRLAIESGVGDQPESWVSTPLTSCDRELRFSVFADGHLEKLVLRGLEVLERAISRREHHLPASTLLVQAIEQARSVRPPKGKS